MAEVWDLGRMPPLPTPAAAAQALLRTFAASVSQHNPTFAQVLGEFAVEVKTSDRIIRIFYAKGWGVWLFTNEGHWAVHTPAVRTINFGGGQFHASSGPPVLTVLQNELDHALKMIRPKPQPFKPNYQRRRPGRR